MCLFMHRFRWWERLLNSNNMKEKRMEKIIYETPKLLEEVDIQAEACLCLCTGGGSGGGC